MGTDIQEVIDAFLIKLPETVDFTGKESKIYQYFKASLSKCYKTTYENLDYTYDTETYEGTFNNKIRQDTIELIAIGMVKEYYYGVYSYYVAKKQYLGTKDFNKLPDNSKSLSDAKANVDFWSDEFYRFRQEFYKYSEDE